MEYYLDVKKNGIMELEIIMLNEINQAQKATCGMFLLIRGL
jgi:hypothetical protein